MHLAFMLFERVHCKGVKLKLSGSEYNATKGLGVNQLAGGVALAKLSIKSRC